MNNGTERNGWMEQREMDGWKKEGIMDGTESEEWMKQRGIDGSINRLMDG